MDNIIDMIQEIYGTNSYLEVPEDAVYSCRKAGLLIAHDYIEEWYVCADGSGSWEVIRDRYFAATPEWVRDYYDNGGEWTYS